MSLWAKSYGAGIQMKPIKQNVCRVPFISYDFTKRNLIFGGHFLARRLEVKRFIRAYGKSIPMPKEEGALEVRR